MLSERELQRRERPDGKRRCGSSDAPGLLGVGYTPAIDTIELLRGERTFTGNKNTDVGSALEPVVKQWIQDTSRDWLWLDPRSLLVPGHEWAIASPDFIHVHPERGIMAIAEIKNRNQRMRARYGEEGSDEVLESDLVQVAFQHRALQEIARQPWFPFAYEPHHHFVMVHFLGDGDFTEFRLEVDDDFQVIADSVWRTCADMYERYVIGDEIPPDDGSTEWREFFDRRNAEQVEGEKEATPEIAEKIREYIRISDEQKELEKKQKALKEEIARFMGTAKKVAIPEASVSYGVSKEHTRPAVFIPSKRIIRITPRKPKEREQ